MYVHLYGSKYSNPNPNPSPNPCKPETPKTLNPLHSKPQHNLALTLTQPRRPILKPPLLLFSVAVIDSVNIGISVTLCWFSGLDAAPLT